MPYSTHWRFPNVSEQLIKRKSLEKIQQIWACLGPIGEPRERDYSLAARGFAASVRPMPHTAPPDAPRSRRRFVVFGLLAVGYVLVYFHRLCPAVVALDLMRDLDADGALVGLLASAYFYPYALMQIPSGLLSDSWGPRKTITTFFVVAALASVGFALARTPGQAMAARVMVGLGVAMLFVPTMKVLTRWFRPDEFASMTGLFMASGGLGAMVTATPLAWFSAWLGWRGSFWLIGAATLATAAGVWTLVRNSPEEAGLPPCNPAPAPMPDQPKQSLLRGIGTVLGTASFWPLAGWFFCTLGIFFSLAGLWGGPWLMHVYGLSKPQAGNVLAMFAVGLILGGPFMGRLSDRWLRSRKKALVGSAVVTAALVAVPSVDPGIMPQALLYPWAALLCTTTNAVVVVGFSQAKELFPSRMAGTSVGLVNFFPFLGGAVVQPVLGMVLESWGSGPAGYPTEAYAALFRVYLGLAVVGLLLAMLTRETLGPDGKPLID